jgi:hypothetical protein
MPVQTPGEIAYYGYFEASDGKSLVSGKDLLDWPELRKEIQQSWEAAAVACSGYYIDQCRKIHKFADECGMPGAHETGLAYVWVWLRECRNKLTKRVEGEHGG